MQPLSAGSVFVQKSATSLLVASDSFPLGACSSDLAANSTRTYHRDTTEPVRVPAGGSVAWRVECPLDVAELGALFGFLAFGALEPGAEDAVESRVVGVDEAHLVAFAQSVLPASRRSS